MEDLVNPDLDWLLAAPQLQGSYGQPSSSAALGAVAEVEVAADLMARGFAVYRNLSPVGPVDMVAVSESGRVRKIQATLGRFQDGGRRRSFNGHADQPCWDVLAVRFPDGVRYYDRKGSLLVLSGRSGYPERRVLRSGRRARRNELSAQPCAGAEGEQVRTRPRRVPSRGRRRRRPWLPVPGARGVYVHPGHAALGEPAADPAPHPHSLSEVDPEWLAERVKIISGQIGNRPG